MKVEGLVLVDNKATEWNPIFESQMLTYLRLTKLKLGLVINFDERVVKNGVSGRERTADDLDFKSPPKGTRFESIHG